jgi:serine/threonine protein kinase
MTRFDVSSLGALTPAYASPEMLLNLDPDPRDDVYALACVAYSLLAGKHPFDGMPAYRAQHEQMSVPPIKGLGRRRMRALRRGLAFTRNARTPSVKQFLFELRRARDERRTMRVVAASATGALLLAGLTGYSYWAQRCARLDDAFLAKLVADARSAQIEIDPEYKDVLLEQGFQYLDMAERQFDAAILSEGVSSAFGAFRSVLQIDPEAPEPIEGIRRIIRLYESEAERLYRAGLFAQSVQVADFGLALHPRDCTLQRLRQRAAPAVDGKTAFEVRLKSRLQAC